MTQSHNHTLCVRQWGVPTAGTRSTFISEVLFKENKPAWKASAVVTAAPGPFPASQHPGPLTRLCPVPKATALPPKALTTVLPPKALASCNLVSGHQAGSSEGSAVCRPPGSRDLRCLFAKLMPAASLKG
uniref:Uncharacterized protein n=1 Tax=Pipistrellus kuhlii TaxID=59472 RepID=A0A7J7YAD6_PIPKU|nr:hypothetical protein mPipKuh1_010278 [Pipistrellus kuhlii]